MKPTKKEYEKMLNETVGLKHGSYLRKNDPIAFNVGYNDWVRDFEKAKAEKKNADNLTINEIKDLYESGEGDRFYFSPNTMRFFRQTLRMYRVKKLSGTQYLIFAPSYWDGNLMGISQRIFDTTDNDLHDVPPELEITKEKYLAEYGR